MRILRKILRKMCFGNICSPFAMDFVSLNKPTSLKAPSRSFVCFSSVTISCLYHTQLIAGADFSLGV